MPAGVASVSPDDRKTGGERMAGTRGKEVSGGKGRDECEPGGRFPRGGCVSGVPVTVSESRGRNGFDVLGFMCKVQGACCF